MSDTQTTNEPFGVETDLIKNTITVHYAKDEFEFKIPSLMDEIALGSHIRKLRRQADPMDDGAVELDVDTLAWLRAAAYFEKQLIGSSAVWPYSKQGDGTRRVQAANFPLDKTADVLVVAGGFHAEVGRFRARGIAGDGAAGNETVAGSQNPASFAV